MITDHNGRTFQTIAEMCEYHDVSPQNYHYRITHGWTIADALLRGVYPRRRVSINQLICKYKMQRHKNAVYNYVRKNNLNLEQTEEYLRGITTTPDSRSE